MSSSFGGAGGGGWCGAHGRVLASSGCRSCGHTLQGFMMRVLYFLSVLSVCVLLSNGSATSGMRVGPE